MSGTVQATLAVPSKQLLTPCLAAEGAAIGDPYMPNLRGTQTTIAALDSRIGRSRLYVVAFCSNYREPCQ
jgi:hypothetical protein